MIWHLPPSRTGWNLFHLLRPLLSKDTHTDVSQDSRYSLMGPIASDYDAERTAAHGRILPWVLPPEETQALHDGGHGTAPDLIYARGVPDTPNPARPTSTKVMHTRPFRDWVPLRPWMRQETREEDREALPPRRGPRAILREGGIVAIHIEHAGTMLTRTINHLTAAFSTFRPRVDHTSATKGTTKPITDSNARSHDSNMFRSLLDALIDLAQPRLLGIIRNKKRLVEARPWAVRRNRANST